MPPLPRQFYFQFLEITIKGKHRFPKPKHKWHEKGLLVNHLPKAHALDMEDFVYIFVHFNHA